MSLMVACSTDGDGDDGVDAPLSSFVERVDDTSSFAQYFSLERYRAGTDLPDDLSDEELLEKVFIDDLAEDTIAEPYLMQLKLNRFDPIVVPFVSLDASYMTLDGSGSVLVGDFGEDEVRTALEDTGGEVTETDTPVGTSYLVPDDDEDIDTGNPAVDTLYAGNPIVVADDGSQVVFGAEGDGSGALAADDDPTAADLEGVGEVADALDESAVYAAALFLAGNDDADTDDADAVLDEPWVRAGLGTAIEDGQSRAVMALWQADEATAGANAERAAELLGELTECTGEPDVDHDGQLVVVASCAIEEAGFVQRTVGRVPASPLFD